MDDGVSWGGGRRASIAVALAVILAATSAACHDQGRERAAPPDPSWPSAGSEPEFEIDTTVIEGPMIGEGGTWARRGPTLCTGGVMSSLPPQCGGLRLTNWRWTDLPGVERRQRARWGDFHLVGTYDRARGTFTLTRAPAPPREGPRPSVIDEDPPQPPCPTPPGGWKVVDPRRTTAAAGKRLRDRANRAAELAYVSTWTRDGVTGWTAAFTEKVDFHRQDLREVWGGPLCVVRAAHTQKELTAVQEAIGRDAPKGRLDGISITGIGTLPTRNAAWVSVVWAPPGQEARWSTRYGVRVLVDRTLQPVR